MEAVADKLVVEVNWNNFTVGLRRAQADNLSNFARVAETSHELRLPRALAGTGPKALRGRFDPRVRMEEHSRLAQNLLPRLELNV